MLLKTEKWLSFFGWPLFKLRICFLDFQQFLGPFSPPLFTCFKATKQLLHVFPPQYPPTIVMTQMTRVTIFMTQDANMKNRMICVPSLPPLLPFHTSKIAASLSTGKKKHTQQFPTRNFPLPTFATKNQEEFPMVFVERSRSQEFHHSIPFPFAPVSYRYRCHPSIQKKLGEGTSPRPPEKYP